MNSVMHARLRDYRMLWHAAVTHPNPHLSGIIRWGAMIAVIVFGAALTAKDGPRAGLAVLWCGASILLLLNWAWRFMPGAAKLNTPANAQLVPQMRGRLVELSSLVCFVGIIGIASAPYGDASQLAGRLFWIVFLTVGIGLAAAGHQAGSAIISASLFSSVFLDKLPTALPAMLSHPLAVVLSLPVYAVVIVVAARAMFPQAGERHWNMLARRSRWTAAAGKGEPLVEQVAGKQARSWYAASLRRHCARRDGSRLVLDALGPARHLGEIVAALGLMTLVLLATGIFASWRAGPGFMPDLGWLFACILLFIPVSHGLRLGELSGSHAAEQALVRLAPAAPSQAGAFNVRLGRSLMLQVLTGWMLTTGAVLMLAVLGGAGPTALLRAASLCCMVLPIVAVPLRNHASRRGSAAGGAATLFLISLVESLPLGMAVNAFTGMPVLPVAALVSIGFTIVVVMRRLRAMRSAPCAFPAGRMD
ncbi:hypothetical protein [Massilia sp. BSC265]|uniref:hypothetical protein n=1 Tax=Massilia sp. BSC265 TaxID=1549812 RepID=UPI0004E93CAA|nr:hypothetical protein [Massilia sp. BSC265]KFI07105.1 hypothetical protein JN27_11155 [Massilia sp. BSC265]